MERTGPNAVGTRLAELVAIELLLEDSLDGWGDRVREHPEATALVDLGNIAPLRASFLRHLHAENRSLSTRTTYAKAVDQLDAFDQESRSRSHWSTMPAR